MLVAATLGLAPSARADDGQRDLTVIPLEQLLTLEVYSASKFMQKSSEAPSSVTVITAGDIRAYGWRTLADVLRSVRGLYTSYDRNYTYLGARGFLRPGDYNTRFLLQIDGNRINDAVYDQAPVGSEFPLELDLIERIEFVPGPGSSIYGSNAFFGVINVITKKAAAIDGKRAWFGLGQAGERQGGASLAAGDGANSFLLAVSAHRSDGHDLYFPEFDTPQQNHGVAQGLDYDRGTRVYASAVHGPFILSALHAERTKGIPTASFFQPFNDPRTYTIDTQDYANLAYAGASAAGDELNVRLSWGAYDSVGYYVNDDALRTLDHDASEGRWWGGEIKMLSTRLAGHKIVAGLDYERNYRLDQSTNTVAPYVSYLDDHRSSARAGLYAQDEVTLHETVLLNAGLRYDRDNRFDPVLSPRVALIVQLGGGRTIKAIHGTAYRAPNSYELYYAYPGEGGQLPNPALRKERIATSELALVQQAGEQSRLTITAFRYQVSGLITQVSEPPNDAAMFINADPVRATGLELEYERSWNTGTSVRTSYSTAQLGADGVAGDVNTPHRLAKLNLATALPGTLWRAGFETQYVGARESLRGRIGGYWLANLNVFGAPFGRHSTVSLSALNLFDRRYADPGSTEHVQQSLAQDGRALQLKVEYVF